MSLFGLPTSVPFCDIRFICILCLSAKTAVLRGEESTSIFISSNGKGYLATARLTCLNIVSHKTVTIANLTVVARRLLSSTEYVLSQCGTINRRVNLRQNFLNQVLTVPGYRLTVN